MDKFSDIIKKILRICLNIFIGSVVWFILTVAFSVNHNNLIFLNMIIALFLSILLFQSDKKIRVIATFITVIIFLFSKIGFIATVKFIFIIVFCLFLIKKFSDLHIKSNIDNIISFNRKRTTKKDAYIPFIMEWNDYNHLNPFAGRYSYKRGDDYLIIRKGLIKKEIDQIDVRKISSRNVEYRNIFQRLFGLCTIAFPTKKGKINLNLENIKSSKANHLKALIKQAGKDNY